MGADKLDETMQKTRMNHISDNRSCRWFVIYVVSLTVSNSVPTTERGILKNVITYDDFPGGGWAQWRSKNQTKKKK